jgi:two-component system, NtrC family, sensor histidine kinase HydH
VNPPRILVVDDEEKSRELCADFLEEGGYREIDAAGDGGQALALLEKKPYQLVLSDINMPVMDGLKLLRAAKDRFPATEIILMTAYGGLQSALEALRLGAYDYITKPFTQDSLLASVRRCLEKQALAQQLRSAQEELIQKEKLAALGSMAGWLAHRMRNPLNVIQMCSQYLKDTFPDKDERKEVSLAIEDKVHVLEKMIRDFIQFSRSYDPRLRPGDVNALLERVLEGAASRFKVQGVELRKDYAAALPSVPLDPDLMEEVVGNLVDNALEAMSGPGRLTVRTAAAPGGIEVDVTNTGADIDASARDRLFEPFFTTKERGTGLGLAIARRVVESHGGTISVETGADTTFRILLPLEKAS